MSLRSGKIAPITASVLGVKLRYQDGTSLRIAQEDLERGWKAAPFWGLQVVSIYDRRTFEKGHYVQWFAGYDYYCLSRSLGIVETNLPADIPEDVDRKAGMVKQGSEMDKDAFRKLYNEAMQDHEF